LYTFLFTLMFATCPAHLILLDFTALKITIHRLKMKAFCKMLLFMPGRGLFCLQPNEYQ
jgi:hypothetical protein